MTVVSDAASILKSSNIKGIDNVYSFFIPQNKEIADNTTDILITDIGNLINVYGSNRPVGTISAVDLHIYKGPKANGSIDEINDRIMDAFFNAGWTVEYSGPIQVTPETHQKLKIFYFRNYKEK